MNPFLKKILWQEISTPWVATHMYQYEAPDINSDWLTKIIDCGWFSKTMAEETGAIVYPSATGKELTVTMVTSDPDKSPAIGGSPFERRYCDLVFVGRVGVDPIRWLGTDGKPISVEEFVKLQERHLSRLISK